MPRAMNSEEFFKKLLRDDVTGCWLWPGVRSDGGYGRVMMAGVAYKAHRLSAYFSNMIPSPRGLSPDALPADNVLHTCDNPACCNPAHLFVGSQALNIKDMFDKNRNPVRPRGEKNLAAKLNDALVAEILKADVSKHGAKARLARQHGVSKTVIGHIFARKIWKHIEK